jgi:hypothetical protein
MRISGVFKVYLFFINALRRLCIERDLIVRNVILARTGLRAHKPHMHLDTPDQKQVAMVCVLYCRRCRKTVCASMMAAAAVQVVTVRVNWC